MRSMDSIVCRSMDIIIVLFQKKDPSFFKQLLKYEISKPKLWHYFITWKKKKYGKLINASKEKPCWYAGKCLFSSGFTFPHFIWGWSARSSFRLIVRSAFMLIPCLAKNPDDHFSKRLKGSVFRVPTLSRSTFCMSEVAVPLSPIHTVGEWSHVCSELWPCHLLRLSTLTSGRVAHGCVFLFYLGTFRFVFRLS